MKFSIPEGGYYRFTVKIMPIEGGQPQEYQKVVKAKTYEEAQNKFNEWLEKQEFKPTTITKKEEV